MAGESKSIAVIVETVKLTLEQIDALPYNAEVRDLRELAFQLLNRAELWKRPAPTGGMAFTTRTTLTGESRSTATSSNDRTIRE